MGDERAQALHVEIDLRLRELWEDLMGEGFGDWGLGDVVRVYAEPSDAGAEQTDGVYLRGVIGAYLRMAYGRGYVDAVREERAGGATLGRDQGFELDV